MKDSVIRTEMLHLLIEELDRKTPYTMHRLQMAANAQGVDVKLIGNTAIERASNKIKNTEKMQLASLQVFAKKLGFPHMDKCGFNAVLYTIPNKPCRHISFNTMIQWHNGHMHGKYRGFVWVAWARQIDKTSLQWNKIRQEYTDAVDARLVREVHCHYNKKLGKLQFNGQIIKFN